MVRKGICLSLLFVGSVLFSKQSELQNGQGQLKDEREELVVEEGGYNRQVPEVDVSNLTDEEIRQIVGSGVDLSKMSVEEKGKLVGVKIDLATVDRDILSKIKLDGKLLDLTNVSDDELVTVLTAAPQENRPPEITNGFWSFHSALDDECQTLVIAPTPDAIKDDIYLQLWWSSNLPDSSHFKQGKSDLYVLNPAMKLDGLIAFEYDAADATSFHGGVFKPNQHNNYIFKLKRGSAPLSNPFNDPRLIPGTLDNYKKYLRFIVTTANPDLTYVFNRAGFEKNSYITDHDMDLLVAHGFVPAGEMSKLAREAADDTADVTNMLQKGLEQGYIDEDDIAEIAELEIKSIDDLEKKLPIIAEAFGMEDLIESGLTASDLIAMSHEMETLDISGQGNDPVDCTKPENKDKDECKKEKATWFTRLTGAIGDAAVSATGSGFQTIFKKSFEAVGDYFAKGVTFAMEGAIRWIFPSPNKNCPTGYARRDDTDPEIKKFRLSHRGETGNNADVYKPKKPWPTGQ